MNEPGSTDESSLNSCYHLMPALPGTNNTDMISSPTPHEGTLPPPSTSGSRRVPIYYPSTTESHLVLVPDSIFVQQDYQIMLNMLCALLRQHGASIALQMVHDRRMSTLWRISLLAELGLMDPLTSIGKYLPRSSPNELLIRPIALGRTLIDIGKI